MTIKYLKKASIPTQTKQNNVIKIVQSMLDEIKAGGDAAARKFALELDGWKGDIVVSEQAIQEAISRVPQKSKDDICFARDNIRRFAKAQKTTITECQIEILPGMTAGQRQIPISAVGCYIPGGRYSHIASAIMTVTTAKVAGVHHITACSPTHPDRGIPDEILYTMDLCGADAILNLGGVQAVAAMAYGLFGLPKVDMLAGPGNQYVAEVKRVLFGRVGIDMLAGPTDSLVIADETADPNIVAWDLVGQAEHGYNSPVWLVTDDLDVAEHVMETVPQLIETLPEINAMNARAAWRDYAEVILCSNREEMAKVADDYAPEHLHVQAADLNWWLLRLSAYGSLFLGEETTVAFGDKATGTNHVLPTSGAARYTGGLSVHKFMKTVTWQRATQDGTRSIAETTARISRMEGMEGHARTADIRLKKYFPGEVFDLVGG